MRAVITATTVMWLFGCAGAGEAPQPPGSPDAEPPDLAESPPSESPELPHDPLVCRPGCSPAQPDCDAWVRVRFDISNAGTVENARAVSACPGSPEFNRAALDAVSGWTHPSNQAGRKNVTVQLDFARSETPQPTAESPFVILPGTWGWIDDEKLGCSENPHDIHFSDDRSTMFLSFHEPVENSPDELPGTVEYHVLHTDPHLRMKIEGETRTTPSGDLVVWDLVVLSRDRYCWHRTDWSANTCTNHIERCK